MDLAPNFLQPMFIGSVPQLDSRVGGDHQVPTVRGILNCLNPLPVLHGQRGNLPTSHIERYAVISKRNDASAVPLPDDVIGVSAGRLGCLNHATLLEVYDLQRACLAAPAASAQAEGRGLDWHRRKVARGTDHECMARAAHRFASRHSAARRGYRRSLAQLEPLPFSWPEPRRLDAPAVPRTGTRGLYDKLVPSRTARARNEQPILAGGAPRARARRVFQEGDQPQLVAT